LLLIYHVLFNSAEGETLFGSKFFTGFGGKAPNQAVMCKRLGGDKTNVSFIGKLGDDDNGQAYRENFKQTGVDTKFVGMAPQGIPR
jgi:sugar/nucleoside kinase (ribokinase family)